MAMSSMPTGATVVSDTACPRPSAIYRAGFIQPFPLSLRQGVREPLGLASPKARHQSATRKALLPWLQPALGE